MRDQLLADDTVRWAEREIARRLAAPPVDTRRARNALAEVESELQRVVDAIAKIGFSDALGSKLADLEARKRSLTAELPLQSLFGIVRVDREGKGYADLAIGVPTNVVAGAGFEPATFGL